MDCWPSWFCTRPPQTGGAASGEPLRAAARLAAIVAVRGRDARAMRPEYRQPGVVQGVPGGDRESIGVEATAGVSAVALDLGLQVDLPNAPVKAD